MRVITAENRVVWSASDLKLAAECEFAWARAVDAKLKVAPFVGVGCPGLIDEHGAILKGGQNLPGNWASKSFSLSAALLDALPKIGGEQTSVLLHNDAVVQGLSEVPFMQDVRRWGVLTIGTGLGNARFTNREPA